LCDREVRADSNRCAVAPCVPSAPSINALFNILDIMNNRITMLLTASVLAGCTTPTTHRSDGPVDQITGIEKVETTRGGTSTAATFEGYKRDLAQRISQVNSMKVYTGRPQALLRSVVVVKYVVDAQGNLARSEILRSNRDGVTEATALASLRQAAPFPKPGAHLTRHGRVEISETWLFNNDGRFQLRSIAEAQMDR
jgi:protein TonB